QYPSEQVIEVVGDAAGQHTKAFEPGGVLKLFIETFAFRDVADDASKDDMVSLHILTEGYFQSNLLAVLAQPGEFNALPVQMLLPGLHVMLETGFVYVAEVLGH